VILFTHVYIRPSTSLLLGAHTGVDISRQLKGDDMKVAMAVALSLGALALSGAPGAAAASPRAQTISGSFQEQGPVVYYSFHTSPAGQFVTLDSHPIAFFGGLSGTSVSTEHTVVRANGAFETHNTILFSGTVTSDSGQNLGSGTLTVNFNATGVYIDDGVGTFTAHFEIIGGTGALASLRGEGTASGAPGDTLGHGVYAGTIH
jgi:hypothetical protein